MNSDKICEGVGMGCFIAVVVISGYDKLIKSEICSPIDYNLGGYFYSLCICIIDSRGIIFFLLLAIDLNAIWIWVRFE